MRFWGKVVVIAGAMIAALPAPASAQGIRGAADAGKPNAAAISTDGALAAARDLFTMLTADLVDQVIDAAMDQVWPDLADQLDDDGVPLATQQEVFDEFVAIYRELIDNALAAAPAIYAAHFTEDELRQLIAFYQTPLGLRLLEVLPDVTAETAELLTDQLEDVMEDAEDRIEAILDDHGISP